MIQLGKVKKRNAIAALNKKGFKQKPGKRDHLFFHFYYNGKEYPIRTKVSHGSSHSDLRDDEIGLMSKQMMLTKHQFHDFVDCNLTEERYISLLKEQGVIQS